MDYIKAFIVGGIICAITQVLMEKTKLMPGRGYTQHRIHHISCPFHIAATANIKFFFTCNGNIINHGSSG